MFFKRVPPRVLSTTRSTPFIHNSIIIMPPRKRSTYTLSTDETSAKRPRPNIEVGKRSTDDAGNTYWEIGGSLRRVTVSEFNENHLVSIREHFEKDGEVFPSKKGISLPIYQLNAFLSILPQLDSYLADRGINLTRPTYDNSSVSKDVEEEEGGGADIEAREEEAEKELEENLQRKGSNRLE